MNYRRKTKFFNLAPYFDEYGAFLFVYAELFFRFCVAPVGFCGIFVETIITLMISDQVKSRYGNPSGSAHANAPSGKHPMAQLSQQQAASMSNPDAMRAPQPPIDSAEGSMRSQGSYVQPPQGDMQDNENAEQIGAGIFGGEGEEPGENRTPRSVYGY